MTNPRFNRLTAEYNKLQELDLRSAFVEILQMEGNPPETYILALTCKGITSIDPSSKQPIFSEKHRLKIELPATYPRHKPDFIMLTPVWHPNIGASGNVCIGDIGDHGYAPAMGLDDLVIRIIEMIRYENYNPKSAFNLGAAQWSLEHRDLFPLDTRQILEELVEIDIIDDIVMIDTTSSNNDLIDQIEIL